MKPFLTDAQVFDLNEKHGWFQSGDAQSAVSKAFAQDAIEKYELMRAAAPELLAVLQELLDIEGPQPGTHEWATKARAAVAKATGATPTN